MCPVCGTQYKAGQHAANGNNTLPAHFVMYFEATKTLMLSEWPCSAEEDAIEKLMEALTEEELGPMEGLSDEDLRMTLTQTVRRHGVHS
eukprot:5926160-Karenia_brevis.AAC.1